MQSKPRRMSFLAGTEDAENEQKVKLDVFLTVVIYMIPL
jgi:hypothetical protein